VKRTLPLVVFDLDGTLVDSSADLAAGMNATLKRLDPKAAPIPIDKVRTFIGNGARNLVARSLAHAAVAATPEAALPVFLEEYGARLTDQTRFYPGVEGALDHLSDHPLAVLTNKPGDMSRKILDALGAGGRFFRVYGGGDLPSRKPDPEGLLRLMDEAGAKPASTIMVGDSSIDVLTGRGAAAVTVGVTYGFDPESLAAEPPDALLHALADLPDFVERLRGSVLV
jgi:phosphoglycolate phosphatase